MTLLEAFGLLRQQGGTVCACRPDGKGTVNLSNPDEVRDWYEHDRNCFFRAVLNGIRNRFTKYGVFLSPYAAIMDRNWEIQNYDQCGYSIILSNSLYGISIGKKWKDAFHCEIVI
jgi:hypothetical protein